ncbi:hypothetical protein Cyrtocomes_00905 [Candidatus Cyrtobacter comes]|uniref:Transcriptional regulator n=2 Tax=Candidatus Cyrtobacter comes TaxID=675776 RepID=A0ABU5L8S0_9RICK|nr:hypothetical protein [Candidatus Cyrtobacter comes]
MVNNKVETFGFYAEAALNAIENGNHEEMAKILAEVHALRASPESELDQNSIELLDGISQKLHEGLGYAVPFEATACYDAQELAQDDIA